LTITLSAIIILTSSVKTFLQTDQTTNHPDCKLVYPHLYLAHLNWPDTPKVNRYHPHFTRAQVGANCNSLPDTKHRRLVRAPCRRRAGYSATWRHTVSEIRSNHCIAMLRFCTEDDTKLYVRDIGGGTKCAGWLCIPLFQLSNRVAKRKYSRSERFTTFSTFDEFGGFQNHVYAHLSNRQKYYIYRIFMKIDQRSQRKIITTETHAHSWVVQLGQATTPKFRPGQVMATPEDKSSSFIGCY